jgi:hypothetical protein
MSAECEVRGSEVRLRIVDFGLRKETRKERPRPSTRLAFYAFFSARRRA